MNIEHLCVFHGFTKARTPKRKDHAQDCETLIAKLSRSQHPAILPWSLCFEWRPSFRWYGRLTRYRPTAGLRLDTPRGRFEGPRVTEHDLIGKPEHHFSGSCENAREMRAHGTQRRMLCFSSSALSRVSSFRLM
jgi:hypothetical protein